MLSKRIQKTDSVVFGNIIGVEEKRKRMNPSEWIITVKEYSTYKLFKVKTKSWDVAGQAKAFFQHGICQPHALVALTKNKEILFIQGFDFHYENSSSPLPAQGNI